MCCVCDQDYVRDIWALCYRHKQREAFAQQWDKKTAYGDDNDGDGSLLN